VNTVIICAYTIERWSQLEAAVASVESQPLVDEVVLVIDHCDELLEMSRRRWPQHRVVANEGAQGLSDARNTGVTASRGDIIAFLDDDAVAAGDWMQQLVHTFDLHAAVGAPVRGSDVLARFGIFDASAETRAVITGATDPQLRTLLALGSPEFAVR